MEPGIVPSAPVGRVRMAAMSTGPLSTPDRHHEIGRRWPKAASEAIANCLLRELLIRSGLSWL